MLRAISWFLALIIMLPTIAYAEDRGGVERKVRYGILIERAEAFVGEVICRSDRDCELVDHKNPHISLVIRAETGGEIGGRLSVYCPVVSCVLRPKGPLIDLQQAGKLLEFDLSEGKDPGINAVMLYHRSIGQIFIAY